MKYALIIGNNKYNDPKLAQLKTPAADSTALAKVLDDKTIGSFDEVTPLVNQTETRIRRAISTFLTNKKPDDLVLLYFSGHGVLDDRGRLYLALKDTQVDLLKATSIPSSFVADEMDSCRSKRQILVLDCCHSGAFGRGTKGEQKAVTETTFEGSGFGRVVLTASDSTQYAFEGDQVIKQTELSLFTHFLLEGLKTGEADTNNDGHISLDEWYDYTYGKVISETPRQVPHKWSYNQQGDMIIAKNPYVKKKVVELPYELVQALESQFVSIRESGVTELGKYLRLRDHEMVDLAIASLKKMQQDDSRRISLLAERLLSEFEQARTPAIKVTAPRPIPEVESQTDNITSVSSMPPTTTTSEIKPAAERLISRPEVEKVSKSIGTSLAPQKLLFKASFWFKWIGISILGLIFLSIIFDYDRTIAYSDSYSFPGSYVVMILFGIVAGALGFIQWFLFRNRLQDWWIVANAATAIVLGLFHRSLFYADGWWEQVHLRIPLVVWLISNFVLGATLVWNAQEKSSPAAGRTSQRELENLDIPVNRPSVSQQLISDNSFWFKWIGTTILAFVFSVLFENYNNLVGLSGSLTLVLLFAAMTGLTSLIQWSLFRNRLAGRWIAENIAAGVALGLLHNYVKSIGLWWEAHLGIVLLLWLVGNYVLGLFRIGKIQESSKNSSSVIEAGARQNIFLLLLSISLVLASIANTLLVLELYNLLNTFWVLYGISAILVSLSIMLKKDIPRNFGFITLAVFMFFDGVNVERLAANSEYPLDYFALNGITALVSGFYFVSQGATWKNFGFIMLSGFLISIGVAGITVETEQNHTFLIFSILFAIPAAVYFFLRKEQSQRV